MSRKRTIPDSLREKREKELALLYYENEDTLRLEQYNKYHFRLFYKSAILDVWPVSLTCYNRQMSFGAKGYKSTKELLNILQESNKKLTL